MGEELNPEREELLVDMDVVRERGLEIINTTAYIAITGEAHIGAAPEPNKYGESVKNRLSSEIVACTRTDGETPAPVCDPH